MFRTHWDTAAARLAAAGHQAAESLAERRQAIEDRIEAARHDLDEHLRAQRQAFAELAAVRRAARAGRPLPA